MKEVTTYLTFDGNTREAMTFYKDCLGAELQMMPFSEGQLPDMPETAKKRIMHARLGKGSSTILMASDTMPGAPYQQGNNFSISLHCESMSEIQGLFNSLGKAGQLRWPTDPNHIYGSSQNMSIYRRVADGSFDDVTPFQATDEEKQAVWMSFLAMDNSETSADPRTVFAGSTRVWKTVDDGEHWEPVSEHLDGSEITALEVSSVNPWLVFAGTKKGGVFRSIDRGNNWSESLAGVEIQRQMISRIACHPQDSNIVMLTVPVSPKTPWVVPGPDNTFVGSYYPHVFFSHDAGLNWTDADPNRHLPDVAYTSLCFHTKNPKRVFLGGALGVYEGDWDDETYQWGLLTGNLPNVLVTDVVYHKLTDSLFAATYGRGIWKLELTPKAKKASPKRKKPQNGEPAAS